MSKKAGKSSTNPSNQLATVSRSITLDMKKPHLMYFLGLIETNLKMSLFNEARSKQISRSSG